MLRFTNCCLVTIGALGLAAMEAGAQRLLSLEGIELRGSVRLVEYGAGDCNVIEGSETAAEYERKRANHGQPLDIWQVDIAVYNGSERWLDHVAARYQVEAAWPPCTNWSEPPAGRYPALEWAGAAGHIQESGRNVVAPRETLSATHFIIVFHEDEPPRFENWTMQYELGELPASPVNEAGIAGRTPAGRRAGTPDPPAVRESLRPQSTPEPSVPEGPICTGRESSEGCWAEISNHPGCYLWNPGPREGFSANWSGECSEGFAEGRGEISWQWNDGSSMESGSFRGGKREGFHVVNWLDGERYEGSYVNDERQGTWTSFYEDRDDNLARAVGPYVDGERQGTWTEFYEGRDDGLVRVVGPWVNGELHGTWVYHYADGNQGGGPYVNGKRHGTWTFFYEDRDDNLARSEGPFVDGERHGTWTFDWGDGGRDVGPYVNGERHGVWTGYGQSGNRLGTVRYQNGRPVGGQ